MLVKCIGIDYNTGEREEGCKRTSHIGRRFADNIERFVAGNDIFYKKTRCERTSCFFMAKTRALC